jgi:hypothetical protein
MELRIDPELDAKFKNCASSLNQSASNLIFMLMDSLVRSMERDGHVVIPIEIKTLSDFANNNKIK